MIQCVRDSEFSNWIFPTFGCALLLLLNATPIEAQTPPYDAQFDSGFETGEISLRPPFSAVLEGSSNAMTVPLALILELPQAVAGNTFVPITSSDPARLTITDGGVTVLAGQSKATVLVSGITAGAAAILVQATLGNTATAAVRVEKALNETGVAAELDYCATLHPPFFSVAANAAMPALYARVFEAGVTEFAGPPGGWMVGAGYGPAGSDPRLLSDWFWFAATYNLQAGNDDEYAASLVAPRDAGVYHYAFRMSAHGGGNWTYCDFDGAGSNPGNDFSLSQLPKMYVYGNDVLNGTGEPEEADYCVLQFPTTFSVAAGATTTAVYGQLYEALETEDPGAPAGWTAQVGFGPKDSDPRVPVGWTFFNAPYNTQAGNNDEFGTTMQAPGTPGEYAYAFRVSEDGGSHWTYCDLNGAGANPAQTFSPLQLGLMTVQPPPP